MRKVVLYQLLSLDGVAEEPGDWFFDIDQDVVANLGRVIGAQDAILLGRNTYEYWVGYWPTSDVEPFASFINNTPKHVVTSTAPAQEWANTTLVTTPVTEHVLALKQLPGADIGIHGSIELARSLLSADLVDELRLVLAPAIAGGGKHLFDGDAAPSRLELLDVERTPTGTLLLGYRVQRPE